MGIKWEVDEDGNATCESVTAGTGSFDSITLTAPATLSDQAVSKGYVDSLVQGLDWQESVLDFYNPTLSLPPTPSDGDRYISEATGNGWTEDYIYEWDNTGAAWEETAPNDGMAVWVEDEDVQYVYNGSDWVLMGSSVSHNVLSGLQGGTSDEYYHFNNVEHTWLVAHTSDNGSQHSFIDQDVTSIASPTFAGLTLTALSGVLKATAGVVSGSATLDDVADGVTYSRINATQVVSGDVVKLTDSSGDDLSVDCNGGDRTLTVKSNVSLNQDLQTTDSPTFNKVTLSVAPVDDSDAVRKDYVDSIVANLNWQDQVLDRHDPTSGLPVGPSTGDRYIATATANGWTANNIYHWDGLVWLEIVPTEGFAVWVEDEDKIVVFNGSAWVIFSAGGSGSAGYVHVQSSGSATWNVQHNLSSKYVQITCYDSADSVLIPDSIVVTDGDNLVTTFATSRTGRAVISAPATVAVNTYLHTQSVLSDTWTVQHNLQNSSPVVQVYDSSNEIIIAESITATDENTITVTFSSSLTGKVRVVSSGAASLYSAGQIVEAESGEGVYLNCGLRYKRTSVSSDYSIRTDDYLVTITDTSVARTITLPSAGTVSGKTFVIKDESGGASLNNITVDTEGAETIDGAASFVIGVNFGSIAVYSDGTNYYIM